MGLHLFELPLEKFVNPLLVYYELPGHVNSADWTFSVLFEYKSFLDTLDAEPMATSRKPYGLNHDRKTDCAFLLDQRWL